MGEQFAVEQGMMSLNGGFAYYLFFVDVNVNDDDGSENDIDDSQEAWMFSSYFQLFNQQPRVTQHFVFTMTSIRPRLIWSGKQR
jgi:hypothetical protein